jgi:uncharacterized membrane-anchored protein YjiN (DUF445 family)
MNNIVIIIWLFSALASFVFWYLSKNDEPSFRTGYLKGVAKAHLVGLVALIVYCLIK